MASESGGLIDRMVHTRALRRWRRAADRIGGLDLDSLRELRGEARALRRQLDRVLHEAEGRLALPVMGSNAMHPPPGADWSWRPGLWRGPVPRQGRAGVVSNTDLGEGAVIFHDCRESEITARQMRNNRERDLAPFGLRLDVFHFDGSFLSIVLDLPEDAVRGLRKRHLIRLDMVVETEKPLEIFARLNVRHGPNEEQIVREMPLDAEEVTAEFDLAYSRINEKRVERAWVDLIFEGPELNQILLRDVTLSRRPRADL
ncbi:MAG: DUF6478 family protein [Gemmobacter sp.]